MPFPEPDLPASPVTDPTIIDSHAIFGEDEDDTDADGESDEVQGDHHVRATPISIVSPAAKSPPAPPDPRRLFQRLWTDDDEIRILEGFLEFTSQRGTTGHAHQHDTEPFYERIRSQVELDFSKSQLVEKLRRLKKKFRTNMAKMSGGSGKEAFFAFKSAHDRKSYEISEKIWGGGLDNRKCDDGSGDGGKIRKRGRKSGEFGVEVKVEETATTSSAVLAVAAAPESVKGTMDLPMVEDCVGAGLGERWRQQQILELEVYSKRLALVQEEIKATLMKLRSGR